jgi:hypothetical protein
MKHEVLVRKSQFFSLYQLHPYLWDSKCKEYSNKHVKEHGYKELVTKCKEQFPTADKEFVVNKIHAFRCSFRRELKKVSKVRHICRRCVCADSVALRSIKLHCRFRNPKKREVEYGLGGRDRLWRYHPGPGYLQSPTFTLDKQRASSHAFVSHCTPAASEERHSFFAIQ